VDAGGGAAASAHDGGLGSGLGNGGAVDDKAPPGLAEATGADFSEAQAVEVLQVLRSQLQLDVEVPVSAFIIIERCLQASAKRRLLTAESWRPLLITAVILAAKTWYDEQLWLVDVRHQLRGYFELEHLGRQEAEMCKLVQFRFNVTPKSFYEYYFALRDLGRKRLEAQHSAQQPEPYKRTGHRRGSV